MLKVGDTVKIISATTHYGEKKEFIPIGTICRVVGVTTVERKGIAVGLIPDSTMSYTGYGEYWYLECEVEKGHMEWVKDE